MSRRKGSFYRCNSSFSFFDLIFNSIVVVNIILGIFSLLIMIALIVGIVYGIINYQEVIQFFRTL